MKRHDVTVKCVECGRFLACGDGVTAVVALCLAVEKAMAGGAVLNGSDGTCECRECAGGEK